MIKANKQDINDLDLSDIVKLEQTQLDLWADENKLNRFQAWLLPQLLANFGRWKVAITNGSIDILATIKLNCSDPKQQQFWKLTQIKRSKLIGKQIAMPKYATFTPLILAGLKQSQGFRYEQFRGLSNLSWILEPDLFQTLNAEGLEAGFSLGSSRLLEIRQQGLTQRSGTKAGQQKSAESTWSLAGIQDTELGHLPKLAQTMLTQIWLAHPKHRDQLMILDPLNWDNMPAPLISNDLFKKPELLNKNPIENKSSNSLLPWMIT
jgi:hypothetical protein